MSLSNIPSLDVRALLKRYGLRPDKRLGQNFLEDASALASVARAAAAGSNDTILEIGAGLGSLTRYLAASAGRVITMEIDPRLLPALRSVVSPFQNVEIVEGDILKTPPSSLINSQGYLVAANIPYYITSAIIRHLLENEPRPRRIVLTIQKEVAERICAAPGDLSLLALSVQIHGTPEVVDIIPARAFFPVPEVDSAILVIQIHPDPLIPPSLLPTFFTLAKAGFAQKRKTLRNSLASGLRIPPQEAGELLRLSGIDPMRRAETLDIPEWEKLCKEWADR